MTPKPPHTLRLLHTADWHLGKRLVGESRYDEFGEFLDWLIDTIAHHQVNVLVVAGDVFDTMTPSNKAQELYYRFLARLNHTGCRHAIIVAGNHDSPSLLDAPKHLFRHFNIHVVGTASENLADELFVLDDDDGRPTLIVAAVPYLRDKDIRKSAFDDSLAQKERATVQGIYAHYHALVNLCKETQNQLLKEHDRPVPLLATGHLFATGASVSASDDGMRELYVGTLGQIGADCFDGFDYVALGHIHREQMVAKHAHIRYSGSPMSMGFGESGQDKKVLLVDFALNDQSANHSPSIHPISIPTFRTLIALKGTFDDLTKQLTTLKHAPNHTQKPIWLALEVISDTPMYDLQNKMDKLISDSDLVILSLKNSLAHAQTKPTTSPKKSLKELTPDDVFLQSLTQYFDEQKTTSNPPMDNTQQDRLLRLYQDIVYHITHDDQHLA